MGGSDMDGYLEQWQMNAKDLRRREYLRKSGLGLGLVNLPGYSPDFNGDEAIWGWAREKATGNRCLGSREAVQERVGGFVAGVASRKDEVRRRCRPVLQSRADAPEKLATRFPEPNKCTSHLGFCLRTFRGVDYDFWAGELFFRSPSDWQSHSVRLARVSGNMFQKQAFLNTLHPRPAPALRRCSITMFNNNNRSTTVTGVC